MASIVTIFNEENTMEYTDGNTYSVLGFYNRDATSTNGDDHCGDFTILPPGVSLYEADYNTDIMNAMVAAGSWGGKCICAIWPGSGGNFRCINPLTEDYCGGGGFGARSDVGYATADQDIVDAVQHGYGIRSTHCNLNIVIYFATSNEHLTDHNFRKTKNKIHHR